MRYVTIRQDGSKTTYIRGHVVTDRNATHEKRIRVGRVLRLIHSLLAPAARWMRFLFKYIAQQLHVP